MNKISPNIPNKIKQPAQCCVHCGKSYKNKTNLDKHVIICDLLNKSKKSTVIDDEEEVPSQRKMYQILLELANKFNKMEEKMDEINKWVIKKKKKINVIEWLNANVKPEIKFDLLIDRINVSYGDIEYLFENSYNDTLNRIFSRNIYVQNNEDSNNNNKFIPMFAFIQKQNIFYVYDNEETRWVELSKDNLIKFLNKVYMKLFRCYTNYKKENAEKIRDDESFSLLCDKTSVKMMNVDFRQDATLSKIRSNMYSKMKADMKGLVEYEFEF